MANRAPSSDKVTKVFQKFIYYLQMPMSLEKLTSMQTGTLRLIASMFKAFSGTEARSWTKNELVRFICGHQQDPAQFKPIERIPGIEYPTIEDQKFRRMFEDKKDPWQRPGRI